MDVQLGKEEMYRLVSWIESNKNFALAKDGKLDSVYHIMSRGSMVRDDYHKATDRSLCKGINAPVFVQPPAPAKLIEVPVGYRPNSY